MEEETPPSCVMMRTATNVLGDASCAVIVNRMIDRETAKN